MRRVKINELCYMAIMLALLIVCSKISVTLGPIPITLQTFAVIMVGYVLKLKKAFIVFLAYIVMGLVGIPVFSGGGGFDYIFKPSFGFIIGFMLSSLITGITFKKHYKVALFAQGLLGLIIIDVIGLVYMYLIMNFYLGLDKSVSYVLEACLLPFLLKDCISVMIATMVYERVSPIAVINPKPIY